jgi:hypothetical protein
VQPKRIDYFTETLQVPTKIWCKSINKSGKKHSKQRVLSSKEQFLIIFLWIFFHCREMVPDGPSKEYLVGGLEHLLFSII